MKLSLTACLLLSILSTGCNKAMPFMSLTGNQGSASQVGTGNIPVIIVAGQSNAVGQGQNYPSPVSGMTWKGLDYTRGIGPAFADSYLAHSHRPEVIVIQCAVGGTSIAQWQAGGPLYTQCIGFVDAVKQAYPKAQVAALVFWQGESDAGVTNTWSQSFTALVQSFRSLLDKNLPVVFAQLDPNGVANPDFTSLMNQQAQVSIPFTTMVKTVDVQMFTDGLHVNGQGLDIIGRRMAQAYFGETE